MSKELVEKVKEAVASNCELYEEEFDNAARAAIRTVLKHYSEAGNVTDGMAKASLHALIDFVESEEDNERDKIAAAMDAALREM